MSPHLEHAIESYSFVHDLYPREKPIEEPVWLLKIGLDRLTPDLYRKLFSQITKSCFS